MRNICGLTLIQIVSQNGTFSDYNELFTAIKCKKKPFTEISLLCELSLYHGLICSCPIEAMFKEGQNLAGKLLKRIISVLSEDQSKDTSGVATLLCGRLLNHVILRLIDYSNLIAKLEITISSEFVEFYSIDAEISKLVIEHLRLLGDHYLDSIKHLARESFVNFVKFHTSLDKKKSAKFFINVAGQLLELLPQQKFAFCFLSAIIPVIEVNPLITLNSFCIDNFVKLLSDPVYASYAISLLVAVFTQHYQEIEEETWISVWHNAFFNNFSIDMLPYGFESIFETLLTTSACDIKTAKKNITTKFEDNVTVHELCLLIMMSKIYLKNNSNFNTNYSVDERNLAPESENDIMSVWKNVLPYKYIVLSLNSSNDYLRNLAFNLLIESWKITELFCHHDLRLLLLFIKNNVNHQAVAYRQQFLNNIKKMLIRLNKGIYAKAKLCANNKEDISDIVASYENFITELFKNMIFNLHFSANHPRITTSLQILKLMNEILWNENSNAKSQCYFYYLRSKLFSSISVADTLLLCMCDSYELNKKFALSVLQVCSPECSGLWTNFSAELFKVAHEMSSSARPLDSMTACYLFNAYFVAGLKLEVSAEITQNSSSEAKFCYLLLEDLKNNLSLAQNSLLTAASTNPMYGKILCLRTILTWFNGKNVQWTKLVWEPFIIDLISVCINISETVSAIVKNSSPEGQLPSDFDAVGEILDNSLASTEIEIKNSTINNVNDRFVKAEAVTAQMILLCGWRNIKEISLMFGFLAQNFLNQKKDYLMVLSLDSVEIIGNFFIEQLYETKHRGAFEQAYAGFIMICNALWKIEDERLNVLPETWLKQTLNAIEEEKNHSKLCATRRSAGLPFVVQAILTTEPKIKHGELFQYTMSTLLKIAADNDAYIDRKLHAFNILRALYKETKLGDAVVPYVSQGVSLALNGFKHPSWIVRNASTLLFASLTTRMLGVKRSQDDLSDKNTFSAFLFFKRYPDLYDFFLDEMKSNVEIMKTGKLAPAVFPMLMILARFTRTSSQGHSTAIDISPFIPFILYFTSSPIYKIRELAASAIIPFITSPSLPSVLDQVCSSLKNHCQNSIHGSLICLQKLLDNYYKQDELTSQNDFLEIQTLLLKYLPRIVELTSESNRCLITKCYAMDILKQPYLFDLFTKATLPLEVTRNLMENCLYFINKDPTIDCKHTPGYHLAVTKATELYIKISQNNTTEIFGQSTIKLYDLISHHNSEVKLTSLEYAVKLDYIPIEVVNPVLTIVLNTNFDEFDADFYILLLEVFCKILKTEKYVGDILLEDLLKCLQFLLESIVSDTREDFIAVKLLCSGLIVQRFWAVSLVYFY